MRLVRYTLVCLSGLLFAAVTPVSAQQQTPPPAAVAPEAQPTGPVRTLSIEEAVELALRNNLGLQIERLNPQIEDEMIAGARASYLPVARATFGRSGATIEPQDFIEGTEIYSTSGLSSQFSFTQNSLPWANTQLNASWTSSRNTTERKGAAFNPNLGSTLNLSATQPLWRNLFINPVKNQIEQAVISRQIADINLRQRVVGTERSVRQAYWNLVGAIERLNVARQNLELSETQLKNNKVRVEVGTMAPIDIIAAEAEVAGNEEAVIVAEADIQTREDQLRMLIFDPSQPDFWTARIQPTTESLLQPLDVNAEAAIASALESRTDMVSARRQLQISDLSLKLAKNQTLPDVSLSASVRANGSGGTRFFFNQQFEEVADRIERPFGDALSDSFGFAYPNWGVSVTYAYPIGKEAAEANLARARIQRRQQDAQMKNLELSIVQQVRQAARAVQSNFQRVQSTKVARELAEKRLEAQQKRFDVGLSTLFELTQAQRDVVLQRNSELNAVIAYNQALVDFQLVQVAPLGGGI
jgi:outer membrane protein TolC